MKEEKTKSDEDDCYPEENFGKNQLLGGLISLSPLCPNLTIDLHCKLPPKFSLASPCSSIMFRHSSLSFGSAHIQIYPKTSGLADGAPPLRVPTYVHFHSAPGFNKRPGWNL